MAANTNVDVEAIKKIAKEIGGILDDHQKQFDALNNVDPNAGKFDAAEWIEDLFVDRRDAVLTHAKYLRMAFEEINVGLHTVADAFAGVDAGNAAAIAKAKDAIKGMADAEFTPTTVAGKTNYSTGDNKNRGDKDTFDYSDPNKPKLLEFDPKSVHGMNEFMNPQVGAGNDKPIDFNQQSDVKGDHSIEVPPGVAPVTENPVATDPPKDPPKDPPPADNPPANTNPPTGQHFNPKAEPDVKVYPDYTNLDWGGDTYRSYTINGQEQTDGQGHAIYWLNNKPYTWEGDDPEPLKV